MCGQVTMRRPCFFAAFPDRSGELAAFPLSGGQPPVPSWRMTECQQCGVVSPVPYPTADEIDSFYATAEVPNDWEVVHYVRLDLNPKAIAGTEHLADQFTRLLGRPGRLLEVGCASGWVLKASRDLGWTVRGVELAPKFSSFARNELGLDVYEGTVTSIDPDSWPRFDVLAAFDVFEHLQDPVATLQALRGLAAEGAYLLLTTPDVSATISRFWGLRWRQVLPSHINYSTPASMAAVLARSGWALERISEPRYWDPDPGRERSGRFREIAKFLIRTVLYASVVRPGERYPWIRTLPGRLTWGRMDWEQFRFRAGDQPVLGDVMFAVARPIPA
jgi:2-polyprenyl-3-methyl-5-hydroxy-6-metoxy-1,4-benzoquinol methylase